MSDSKPGFLARYKGWIIAFLVIWAVLLAFLILGGEGENLPFQYQVF
jgi:hypothetical protein